MNDIAAPILMVFIANKLKMQVSQLEELASSEKVKELCEEMLLEVDFISLKPTVISVLQIFWRQ